MLSVSKSQKGMTAIGMLGLLVLIGFVLMLAVKSMPSYMQQFKVSSAMKNLVDDSRIKGADAKAIRTLLEKKFSVDDVEGIGKDNIILSATKTGYNLQIKYERRVPMVGNVDAVYMFDESIELVTR